MGDIEDDDDDGLPSSIPRHISHGSLIVDVNKVQVVRQQCVVIEGFSLISSPTEEQTALFFAAGRVCPGVYWYERSDVMSPRSSTVSPCASTG
jgi:hypothetical protein